MHILCVNVQATLHVNHCMAVEIYFKQPKLTTLTEMAKEWYL